MANPPVRPTRGLMPWESTQGPRIRAVGGLATDRPSIGPGSAAADTARVGEAHRYASIINLLIPVTAVAPGILVLAEPAYKRNYLGLRNTDATDTIYVQFGNNASATSFLSLAPGQMIAFDVVVPQNDIFAVSSANTPALAIAYSTFAL